MTVASPSMADERGALAFDTGAGLGALHQTGWTGLVADLVLRREP